MDRAEFCSLPLPIALGLIYDMARAKLEPMRMPDVPRAPAYDGRFSKGNQGFCWMSEMTLRDLEFWEAKKRESAASGSKWAEKDAKTAETLARWVAWRRLYPSDIWSGKRGDERASAAPPSAKPAVHPWPARGESTGRSSNSKRGPATSEPEEDEDNLGF